VISAKEIRSRNRNESDCGDSTLTTTSPFADVTGGAGNVADVGWRSSLEINIVETPRETRWILRGRLFGPWVRALGPIWKTSTRTGTGRNRIVVLNEVSFVDDDAKELLCAMSVQGARFIANGRYIEGVLDQLKIGAAKSVSGRIVEFFTALWPKV